MKILAIDTSSKICSVAILEDEKIIEERRTNGREIRKGEGLQSSRVHFIYVCQKAQSVRKERINYKEALKR